MAQRYGCRPSDLIGIDDKMVALDFDAAIAIRASTIEEGILLDPGEIKQRRTQGMASLKALQQRVIDSYQKRIPANE